MKDKEITKEQLVEELKTNIACDYPINPILKEKVEELKEHTWSVWVGGVEVNDYYLTYEKAKSLANEYINGGYDDVVITSTDPDKPPIFCTTLQAQMNLNFSKG